MHHDGIHYFPLGGAVLNGSARCWRWNHEYTDERYVDAMPHADGGEDAVGRAGRALASRPRMACR